MRTGVANLPLHYGKAPRWLFDKMRKLAREITIIIVDEFGAVEFLKKISSPFWFQSFGALLGFDWHSSGVTTTVCGALKEGVKGIESEIGLFVAGGKGKTSRKTPQEIEQKSKFINVNPESLMYASRMSAKVDSSGLQDGYQIYHHTFFFTKNGEWAVVQQGMNLETRFARRYHWFTKNPEVPVSFVSDPHNAISATHIEELVLNTVAKGHKANREMATKLSKEKPDKFVRELKKIQSLNFPSRHEILLSDINPDRLYRIFEKTYERQPENFETLLGLKGVGPKTIRALSLASEVIYGKSPSFKDPARFSFAHGGKDGYPYPVDKNNYEQTIAVLERAISRAKIGQREKLNALHRLNNLEFKL
ncbi:DUF763 domain-containing protein [candidate division WOR-3 bacterium]|nr:DUF763 domain-containing protein [candidate division WOR-3 bacterium]